MASKKKIYKKDCDWCSEYYEGVGKQYCSRQCYFAFQAYSSKIIGARQRRKDLDALLRPVHIHVTPKKYTAAKEEGLFHSVHYGDIHFPFEDPRALTIRNKILDFLRPEMVVDHGDTGDCEAISRFPKDPFNRTPLSEEIKMMAADFGEVHALTPDAEHIWFEGNHEERLKRTLWKAAEARDIAEILTLEGVKEHLAWGNLLGLDNLGWECIAYPEHKLIFGKLMLVHGNTVRVHSAYSAKAEHDRYGKSGISGHTHRLGAFYHTDYNGVHSWHELGLLGSIRTDYVAHANWQQGMGVVTWSDNRQRWGFEPIMIHEGVAFFRGLRFEG